MYVFLTNNEFADEVKKYVVDKTKLNPDAFKTIVIPEIPKNDSGKTLYKELAKYYEQKRNKKGSSFPRVVIGNLPFICC